ncbi:protein phosphatase 2 [Plasmodium falciparum IGH-CR14]|uniref:Protein phosphatase PP2A regulatory subunit A n=5 Tax=Plasmodium falciparum TaxID=5833 RepID=A0A024W1U9_PLAFA|nr:hypothetical protein PFFVO_04046 [Plasmodium falciparum Vietnam Oak-Knoll (FVO)]ETW34879.1 hypothetical protein PFTANZ_04412 [Plasmodium falciparum Tanzania (2000708)]ETW40972.1 hypothetical protein PFNF135_04609 [Plasmodium falciparum NF135/5.C10]KNG77656.1 protein phosphatase 2 [Plasmodium falciparum IGH-CR14]
MSLVSAQEIIDGMQSPDCKIRLRYIKELRVLCEIIGNERTKNELIEFLYNLIEDDSEVLIEISKNFKFLISFIGNVNNCNYICYLLLNFLIAYEKDIHLNAYEAFKIYINKCDPLTLTEIIYPKILELAKNDGDNYRIGICKIIPMIIEKSIKEGQSTFVKTFIYLFLEACQDESILVKKSSCDKFGEFIFILKEYKERIDDFMNVLKMTEGKMDPHFCIQEKGNKDIDIEIYKNVDIHDEENKSEDDKNYNRQINIIVNHKTNDKEQKQLEIESNNIINIIQNKNYDKIYNLSKDEKYTLIKEKEFINKIWEKSQEIYYKFFSSINGLDEVQISAVSILHEILNNDINFVKNIKDLLTNICNDDSWRVRAELAKNIYNIWKIIKNEDFSLIILLLLKDLDNHVRSIILNNLHKILFLCSNMKMNIMEEIFDDLKRDIDNNNNNNNNNNHNNNNYNNNNVHLRISLCELLCSLPDILDKNLFIEYILPLFLLFIRIEETNLKSDLFICLHKISRLISFFDMKQIIIPLCNEIIKNKNWRLRYSMYYCLKFFDHYFFFQNKENIESKFLDFWNYIYIGSKDLVYSIRMQVVETLEFLLRNKNFSFFKTGITYLLNNLKQSNNYIFRITCLQYISKLIIYFPLEYIQHNILYILDDLCKDKISNIRFNIIKTIYYIQTYVQHVLLVINNNSYDEIINKITNMIHDKNQKYMENNENKENIINKENKHNHTYSHLSKDQNENIYYKDNYNNDNTQNNYVPYFHSLENKYNLINNQNHDNNQFIINSCATSSLSFYDNMKNTDTNKKSCEIILYFLADKLNYLSQDTDQDVLLASTSLKNEDFSICVNVLNIFNTLCKPIK